MGNVPDPQMCGYAQPVAPVLEPTASVKSPEERLARARREVEADLETDLRSFAQNILMSQAELSAEDWGRLSAFYKTRGLDLDNLMKQVGVGIVWGLWEVGLVRRG